MKKEASTVESFGRIGLGRQYRGGSLCATVNVDCLTVCVTRHTAHVFDRISVACYVVGWGPQLSKWGSGPTWNRGDYGCGASFLLVRQVISHPLNYVRIP